MSLDCAWYQETITQRGSVAPDLWSNSFERILSEIFSYCDMMEEDSSTDRSEYTAALADQTFWILVDKQTWQYLRTVCPPPSWRCSVETLLLNTTLLSRQCNEIFLDEIILTLTLRQTHWWPRSILQTCGVDCSMKFEAGITREHRNTPPGHTIDHALWSRVGHAPMTQLTIP